MAQAYGRAQALVGETGRHPDVGHHQIRPVRGDRTFQRLGVPDGGDHLETEPGEQAREAFAQQHAVLGKDY